MNTAVVPITALRVWKERCRQALWEQVLPFWEQYSLDRTYGGYFNGLDRDGQVYDDRKYLWLQGRQVWMYSQLAHHATLPARADHYRDLASLGLTFLRCYGHRDDHRVYFSLTRQGDPVYLQRKIFSECFYVMALAAYAQITRDPLLRQEALTVFDCIWQWSQDLTLVGRPAYIGVPPTSTLAIPMILLNVIRQLQQTEWDPEVAPIHATYAQQCVAQMQRHAQPSLRLVLENVTPEGSQLDSPEGRLVNPGHAIEAGWFLLDYAQSVQDTALTAQALDMVAWSLEAGWDTQEGGLFYFIDAQGYAPPPLESPMKLWWPHCEALIATAWGYALTRDAAWWQRFEQVASYTFEHFPDPEYGEWYGYLDRYGRVTHRFKGGAYKGCFHVPRALWMCDQILGSLLPPSSSASFVTIGSDTSAETAPTPGPASRPKTAPTPSRDPVVIYSDGSCVGNPGPGGYGAIIVHGGSQQELSGGFRRTTNNRMEMMAVIVALQTLKNPSVVKVYSDSQYVVNAMTKGWAKKWRAQGWQRNSKEKAVNPDLWAQLLDLAAIHQVSFHWVRGHSGHPENERCDRLALTAAHQSSLPPDLGYPGA